MHHLAENRTGDIVAHHVDRLVLEADGATQRRDGGVGKRDQRQFIRQQAPATVYQASAQGTFARAWGGRHDYGASFSFHHSGMQQKVVVGMHGNTPVHRPLQQRECVVFWQGDKGFHAIELENRLAPRPAPPT